ncbi:MAG: SprB repeat-containing protein, partial [Phaeodactylibacter sp.]|nr:SprB repeat-containing protein [Phaeodactylibacter sp.]
CMNAFTQQQANHMNLILSTSRSALAAAGNTNCNLAVPLVATITNQTDVSCFGDADATITVQASGGSGALQYILDNGVPQSSPVFSNVSGGPHTVVVQDQAGNVITLPVVIASPPVLIPVITNQVNVSCFGQSDGLVSVVATGGTPGQPTPYTYSIDGSPFSPNGVFSNLGAGSHLLAVQDGNGCIENQTVTIIGPSLLGLGLADLQGPACADDTDGQVQLMGIGGTPLYQYSIDQINYGPSPLFTGLAPGSYLFSVQDNLGCEAQLNVNVTAPAPLELEIVNLEDVLCAGDANGSVTLGASGGTVDYEYSLDGQNFQPGATFNDLPVGTYTLFVQDQNGCQDEGSLEISAPTPLQLEIVGSENVLCVGDAN